MRSNREEPKIAVATSVLFFVLLFRGLFFAVYTLRNEGAVRKSAAKFKGGERRGEIGLAEGIVLL